MSIQENFNRDCRISWLARAGCLGIALSALAVPASADVLLEDNFDGSGTNFSSEGRVYFNNGYVRLRGGETTAITSDMIYTNGGERVTLEYTRATSGLDQNERLTAEVSVDGAAFIELESERDVSGQTMIELPEANEFLQLRFSLSASSFFETAELRNLRVETRGDEEPPTEEPPAGEHTTIVPDSSWDCGMPEGIPDPTSGELLFSTTLPADAPLEVGQTPYGERTVIPVGSGRLTNTGNGLNGEIQPGSLDFDLALPSGAMEHESRFTLETDDGTLIYMRNCGVADGDRVRFVADFEAPSRSDYTWLHEGDYVGIRELTSSGVRLSVYRNPVRGSGDTIVEVPADSDLRQQTWECPALPAGAASGSEVLQARVNIGGFDTVGNSKYGSRRIIPITGGSFSGDFSGSVNPGGADYQLTVNGDLSLEARYTLQTGDGEIIVVRNCGDYGSGDLTLPMFEASTSGRYDWLNQREFTGTITPGLTRVTITVYERN